MFFFFPRQPSISRPPTVLSPVPQHVSLSGSTDVPMFTRTEHPVHCDTDLNPDGRETEVTCYGILIPSPITPPKNTLCNNPDSFVGSKEDFEISTLEELGLPFATTSIRGGESEALRRLARVL